ncbi:iron chaperone [Methylophilus flavus]|uniref:Iron chaperone n=1 Tax=Methylophilus flavus TaxID=640084 RepID=A0ABW3PAG2_9PROT
MVFSSHEEYFKSLSPVIQALMLSIQQKVETLLPEVTRCISYQMPAFRANQHVFFYFAAFRKHIGIYPPVTKDLALINVLQPYRGKKGNLSFPLDQPLPLELIGQVVMAFYREYEAGTRKR